MRHNEDDFLEVYEQLFTQQGAKVQGKPPAKVPIYGWFFPNLNGSDSGSSGTGPGRLDYDTKWKKAKSAFCSDVNNNAVQSSPVCTLNTGEVSGLDNV